MAEDNVLYAEARARFQENYEEASKLLLSPDDLFQFLQKAKIKLVGYPADDTKLSNVPTLINLVKDYHAKKYEADVETVTAALAALLYWVAPEDIIPDTVPLVGMIDDTIVMNICMQQIGPQVEAYRTWKFKNDVPVI